MRSLFILLALTSCAFSIFVPGDDESPPDDINPIKCSQDMADLTANMARGSANLAQAKVECSNGSSLKCVIDVASTVEYFALAASNAEAAQEDCRDKGSPCVEDLALFISDAAATTADAAQATLDCATGEYVACAKDVDATVTSAEQTYVSSVNAATTCF